MPKTEVSQFNYRIKLLASNNVVLVECDNYESEIFSPEIVDGRITFLNIIPNRRCCRISKSNVMNFAKRALQQNTKSSTVPDKFGLFSATEGPLANSTPAVIKQRHSCDVKSSKFDLRLSATDSTLPTPEPLRRAAPINFMLDKSTNLLPKGFKASRIYHNPLEGIPRKVGRLLMSSSIVESQHSEDNSLLDGNFRLPCSPILRTHSSKGNRSRIITPKPHCILHSTPVDSIARWNKVLTPVRTYSKKSEQPVAVKRKTVECLKPSWRNSNIVPSFLYNPTQGLNVSQQVEIKKCRLIRDIKTKISPRSFKKQQTQSEDAYSIKSNFSIHPHSLSFHKSRTYMEVMGMSAFDLLTSSNRNKNMARKLCDQFRKGCINKASATYSKYKVLSTVPPLQQDEEVR